MTGLVTSTFSEIDGSGDGVVVVCGFPSAPAAVTVRGGSTRPPGSLAFERIDPLPPADTFNVTVFVIGAVIPVSLMAISKRMLRGAAPGAVPTAARGGGGAGGGVAGLCAADQPGTARTIISIHIMNDHRFVIS